MLPRTLHDHKVNILNTALEVTAHDIGSGGAPTRYEVARSVPTESKAWAARSELGEVIVLYFQNGPIQSPNDVNGLSNEVLLAILLDRIRSFQHPTKPDGTFDFTQPGPFACAENATALFHLESALSSLHDRTRARQVRGVEGSHEP